MKKHAIAALLAAVALTLASCEGSESGDMHGMDRGGSADRATGGKRSDEEKPGGMARMNHGGTRDMGHEDASDEDVTAMFREMVTPNGEYSDRAFIDAMVPHHEGTVEMTQVALEQAEHEESQGLSEGIIGAQRAEI